MNAEDFIKNINLDIYEPISELPPYAVEASGWGKNSFYHTCDHVGHNKNFSVCRNIMMLHAKGKKPIAGYEQCFAAVAKGKCPAIKMHQEEIDVGRALYYHPRLHVKKSQPNTRSIRDYTPDSPTRSTEDTARLKKRIDDKFDRQAGRIKPTVKVKSIAKKSAAPTEMVNMDMGQIVKDLMKQDTKPVEKISTTPKVRITEKVSTDFKRLPGESPLQFARRKMKLTQNTPEI